MKRGEALIYASQRLKEAGIEDPEREARLLLTYALQCEALELIIRPRVELNIDEETIFKGWLARREKREPLARIHGLREFWGLPFGLNEATLEPRPDTETLVECVLKKIPDKHARLRILDIGTGTGCILLSLLHEYPYAQGMGTDKSARALEAAQQNAVQLGLKTRASFLETHWADNVNGRFDVVVSNPPYIAKAELADLQPEVRDYDPMLALDGGEDGLEPYRNITPSAKNLLENGGLLAFEVGHRQATAVQEILKQNAFRDVGTRHDFQNIARVVYGITSSH
ncbi:MAG: peptide chain release factor N(5)-glutamine methyltransferase [Alphaproteobacteria bacterium]|nr:peptide chain release factor N(5)-glutamine methyltransferase [Alphaproteobacteria bacterium]